jgi:hypothetical protein
MVSFIGRVRATGVPNWESGFKNWTYLNRFWKLFKGECGFLEIVEV